MLNSKKNKLEIGDRVIITHNTYSKMWWKGDVIKVNDENSPFPCAIKVTSSWDGKLSEEFWADRNTTVVKVSQSQMDLFEDFSYLLGEDESMFGEWDLPDHSHLYCNCANPMIKLNTADHKTFKVCTNCKKEKV